MPEIGPTLREARMRARLDISQLEAQTKIRAKYLRALENEEWDLLPGPTYVKSFLREYADALGLDGKLLVEEYKLRHERASELELMPASGGRSGRRRERRRTRGAGRDVAVAAVIVAIVAALVLLGRSSGGGNGGGPSTQTTTAHKARTHRQAPAPVHHAAQPVRLTVVATAPVYVCLEAAHNRILIPGQILQTGQQRGPFRSRKFHMTLGNAAVRLVVDGRSEIPPPSANPLGYTITAHGRTPLAPAKRPTCH